MIQAKRRFFSFDEYLSYEDGTDNLYELYNGELIEVPPFGFASCSNSCGDAARTAGTAKTHWTHRSREKTLPLLPFCSYSFLLLVT